MKSPANEDPKLLELISIALEMRDRGLEPPLEEICRDRLDLVDAVAGGVRMATRLRSLQEAVSTHDPLIHRELAGRYRLVSRLGAGSMGVVYRAEDLELRRDVAVKILRSDCLSTPESEERFEREAEWLAALDHPAVVTVFDRGVTEHGSRFFVMEMLRGAPLEDLLESAKRVADRQGRTNVALQDTEWLRRELDAEAAIEPSFVRQTVRWTAWLANGLQAAHDAGIYHRDIKPSNVFVRRDGRPVLLDFGVAAHDAHATTHRRGAIGTPAYMAPEQIDDEARPSPALDVYGLSATLHTMLTLRPPFAGTAQQVFSVLQRRDPIPAYKWCPGLPRDLQAILDRGMARRSHDRYATAGELEGDLRAFLAHKPVSARHVSRPERVWRRLRRSPTFLAGAAVAVVALTAVVAVHWHRAWLDERRSDFVSLWARVPPTLTLEAPDNRVIADAGARDRVAELLDRAAKASVEPLPARLVRASFRLDSGDVPGAVEDVETVAAQLGSDYGHALVEAYRGLPPGARSAAALPLDALPPPGPGLDAYVAAFHLLRARRSRADFVRAKELLVAGELADYPPARAIVLQMEIEAAVRERNRAQRLTRYIELHDRAVRLEELIGQRTATTANLIGTALAGQERYREAWGAIASALELSPLAHGIHINAGVILRRLGALDEARDHLERALALRPRSLNAHTTLILVQLERGAFETAADLIAAVPYPAGRAGTRLRSSMEGHLWYERAATSLEAGDLDASREAASRAIPLFEEARALGAAGGTFELIVSRVLAHPEAEGLFSDLAAALREDPVNWRRLNTLRLLMPLELSPRDVESLRDYFGSLAAHLAPDFEPLIRESTTKYEEASLRPAPVPTTTDTEGRRR